MDLESKQAFNDSQGSDMACCENIADGCPILDLPTEVLLHIFSYVDSEFLVKSVSLVCRHFHCILSDQNVWKHRVRKRIKFKYPPLNVNEDTVDWQQACAALEKERAYWSCYSDTMIKLNPPELHIAAIDSVALLNGGRLCASGSRDRCVGLWGYSADSSEMKTHFRQDAHTGWIWALLTDVRDPSILFSASWDCTVKCWDVEQGIVERSLISLKAAVLSLAQAHGLIACGTFTGHMPLVDVRAGTKPVTVLRPHKRAALAVVTHGEHCLLSAGEEGFIVSHDLRNSAQPLAKFALRDAVGDDLTRAACYPTCLSVCGNTLIAGDSKGYIWLVDASNGNLQLVESCGVGHKSQVTSVLHNEGVLLTCSMDQTLRAFVPSLPPEPITVLQISSQVTGLDYVNGVLVAGTTSNKVEMYVPRSVY